MNQDQALELIRKALEKTLDREQPFSLDTDLAKEEIIDSLDKALFLLELEKLTDKKIPDHEVDDKELLKIGNMVNFLTA